MPDSASNKPPRLSIYDVLAMFEQFDFSFDDVNGALSKADDESSAFNIFEGLKIQLTVRWEEMKKTLPPERIDYLSTVYDRLQTLKLHSYTPPKKPEPRIDATSDPLVDALLRGDPAALTYVREEAQRMRRPERMEPEDTPTLN